MRDCALDDADRAIVNGLQHGFPVCERPYEVAAAQLGMAENELLARLERLCADGVLTRFGPLYQIERAGGCFLLAAMKVPEEDVGRVAGVVNALPEVAHNYQRDHAFNLWFVLATETPRTAQEAVQRIERETGYRVYPMPKEREYFVEARFHV